MGSRPWWSAIVRAGRWWFPSFRLERPPTNAYGSMRLRPCASTIGRRTRRLSSSARTRWASVRTSLPALRVSRSGRHRVTGMAVKATRSGVASIDECRVPPPSGLSKPQYVHEGGPTPGSNGRTPQLTIQLGRDLIHEHGSGGGAGGEQLRCRAVHRARQGSSAAHAGDEQLGVGDRVHGRQGP